MDRDQYQSEAEKKQSNIFRLKLQGLDIKEDIEKRRNEGFKLDLTYEELKNDGKRIRNDIQRVQIQILDDELGFIKTERQLKGQKRVIGLDGMSSELPLLRRETDVNLRMIEDRIQKKLFGSVD